MGRVVLARNTGFGAPTFPYDVSAATLDPAISRQSNSLAVYPANFSSVAFYEQPNFGGDALVITRAGSIRDLSNTQWGNWANRIASIQIGAQVNQLVDEVKKGHRPSKGVTIVDKPPDDPPSA